MAQLAVDSEPPNMSGRALSRWLQLGNCQSKLRSTDSICQWRIPCSPFACHGPQVSFTCQSQGGYRPHSARYEPSAGLVMPPKARTEVPASVASAMLGCMCPTPSRAACDRETRICARCLSCPQSTGKSTKRRELESARPGSEVHRRARARPGDSQRGARISGFQSAQAQRRLRP